MAHRLALRSGESGDVSDDRLGDVVGDERCCALLGVTADLADHDDRLGGRIGLECGQAVDMGGPDDGVAADAHAGGEADVIELVHHLVGQRAGLRHQADGPRARDVGRDDAGVGHPGRDDARAVGADDARRPGVDGVLEELRRVVHGDALGDDDAERDLGIDSLLDGRLGEARRHEDDADIGTGGHHGLAHVAEDRDAVDLLAPLAGSDARDDLGTTRHHAARVLGALRPRHALHEDAAIGIEPDRHAAPPAS